MKSIIRICEVRVSDFSQQWSYWCQNQAQFWVSVLNLGKVLVYCQGFFGEGQGLCGRLARKRSRRKKLKLWDDFLGGRVVHQMRGPRQMARLWRNLCGNDHGVSSHVYGEIYFLFKDGHSNIWWVMKG